jgi:Tol biopolymer transport system component
MPDTKQLLRETRDRIAPPPDVLGGLERRRRHRENVKRAAAAAVGIVVALLGIGGWFLLERGPAPRPGDRSEELGIFAPLAGRIVYENEAEVGDLGYDLGIWAIDPSGPSDTTEGRSVADDVASTLVRLDLEDAVPLGWSRDGTELLFMRSDGDQLFPREYLFILHADGSETQLNRDPMYFGGASISPDGTRVVYAVQAVPADDLGLYVVDVDGGPPVRLPLPRAEGILIEPTFSPDGTQIAYVDSGETENHVWVMDADGSNAHEILADEAIVPAGSLQWSPAGDRIAGQARLSDGTNVIYTFAPDGSDLTQVIGAAMSPYWSPDGSQIAYTVECELGSTGCGGLGIVDADGSNVREFGFAASGPWHPGASTETPGPTPIDTPSATSTPGPPVTNITRVDGEVLRFTGEESQERGDLVAVDPETDEARVLVEGLEEVNRASWSADGSWIAYDTTSGSLWVVGSDQPPRQVSDGYTPWSWSPTDARLAVVGGNTLSVVDASTGQATELTSTGWTPVWSPDGTRLVFGELGGSIFSVEVRTGERSLLARLPGDDLDSVDQIEWSPDGSRLAILNDLGTGFGRLYVLNADGSDTRVLAEDSPVSGLDWSPDGTRIAFAESHGLELQVWVAPADGSTPSLIATQPKNPDEGGDPVWSPDGTQIAFWTEHDHALVIDADGSGRVARVDALTYESWRGGWFACSCLESGRPQF